MATIGHIQTDYTDGNNLINGTAGTLEPIREPSSRYDFGIKWAGADGAAGGIFTVSGTQPSAGLVRGTYPMSPGFGVSGYKDGIAMDVEFAMISVDWDNGTLAGTIKEKYYTCTYTLSSSPPYITVTARSLVATRDNIDPGFGSIGTGRKGQQYSFLVSGTELRIYNSRESSPVVVFASPPSTYATIFPVSLGAYCVGATSSGFNVTDIRIVRVRPNEFSTIYAARDRAADGVSTGLHARIYQNPTAPLTVRGAVTDVDIS